MDDSAFDTEKKTITSGIRLGTPALTTRGFQEEDMETIATLIHKMCEPNYQDYENEVRKEVAKLCQKYPLYE